MMAGNPSNVADAPQFPVLPERAREDTQTHTHHNTPQHSGYQDMVTTDARQARRSPQHHLTGLRRHGVSTPLAGQNQTEVCVCGVARCQTLYTKIATVAREEGGGLRLLPHTARNEHL